MSRTEQTQQSPSSPMHPHHVPSGKASAPCPSSSLPLVPHHHSSIEMCMGCNTPKLVLNNPQQAAARATLFSCLPTPSQTSIWLWKSHCGLLKARRVPQAPDDSPESCWQSCCWGRTPYARRLLKHGQHDARETLHGSQLAWSLATLQGVCTLLRAPVSHFRRQNMLRSLCSVLVASGHHGARRSCIPHTSSPLPEPPLLSSGPSLCQSLEWLKQPHSAYPYRCRLTSRMSRSER